MKVYKFYKSNCTGCYAMSRTLNMIDIPKNIEIIQINVDIPENKLFAKENGIDSVPVLMSEDGKKLTGGKVTTKQIREFLGGI